MLEMLSEYGVTTATAMELESLVKLRAAYVQLVGVAGNEVAKVQEIVAESVKELRKDPEVSLLAEHATSSLRDMFYAFMDTDESVIVLLVEAISELKSLAIYERDLFLTRQKREVNPDERTSDDFETKRAKAQALRDAIEKLFNGQFMMQPENFLEDKGKNKGFPRTIEGFPLKSQTERSDEEGKAPVAKKGTAIPELPKVPSIRGAKEETTKPMRTRQLQLSFNGEIVFPSETLTNMADVASEIVSDKRNGYFVRWTDIRAKVKDLGLNIMSDNWELDFQTGKLEGKVIAAS